MGIKFFKFFLLILFLTSSMAYAFKVDTHVWVGQQVINDLEDDGKLRFNLDGTIVNIDVSDEVISAILDHKQVYLIGNVGPDAAPDVVAGQSAVHPGVTDSEGNVIGWETSEWLEHLLNVSEGSDIGRAYTYGYLAHAAADVFAHTYVNQYAGDVFNLKDEFLVEQRHFVLESFVGNYTPALKNSLGEYLGQPWEQLQMEDELAEFLRGSLIYNDEVQDQYWKMPTTKHLAAYYRFRKEISSVAEDTIWHEIDKAVVIIVAAFFDVELTPDQADLLVNAAQPAIDYLNGDVPDSLQKLDSELFNRAQKYEELGFERVGMATAKAQSALQDILSTKKNIDDQFLELNSRLMDLSCSVVDESLKLLAGTVRSVDELVGPSGILDPLGIHDAVSSELIDVAERLLDPNPFNWLTGSSSSDSVDSFTGTWGEYTQLLAERFAMYVAFQTNSYASGYSIFLPRAIETVEQYYADVTPPDGVFTITTSGYLSLFSVSSTDNNSRVVFQELGFQQLCLGMNNIFDGAASSHLKVLHQLEDRILEQQGDLIESMADLRSETIQAMTAARKIQDLVIDFMQVASADVSPIQSILRGWVDDVDFAMIEYVKATNQAMVNTMNKDASAVEPIVTWFGCYQLQIIGIPSSVSGCEFRDSLTQFKEAIEDIILVVDEATSAGVALGLPSSSDLMELQDKLIDEVVDQLKEEVSDQLVDILPLEVQEIIELLDTEVDDILLKQFFTKEEDVSNAKGLVMIPDIAERVKAEMRITESAFDPDKYAVAHNAVVLAKLALLGKYDFEELASAAGSSDYLQYMSFDNLVAQAFTNIDGNHQWMETPPPMPNSLNIYPVVDFSYSSEQGFIPWKGDMRDKLFRKLFIGPLSPGIDSPSLIGKSVILNSDYPYKVCSAYPFPDDVNDRVCTVIMLIPIIAALLN